MVLLVLVESNFWHHLTDLHLSKLIMMVLTFRDVSKFANVNPAILIDASSDSGDLPALSRIKDRVHFPLRISSLLVLRHTPASHALES